MLRILLRWKRFVRWKNSGYIAQGLVERDSWPSRPYMSTKQGPSSHMHVGLSTSTYVIVRNLSLVDDKHQPHSVINNLESSIPSLPALKCA